MKISRFELRFCATEMTFYLNDDLCKCKTCSFIESALRPSNLNKYFTDFCQDNSSPSPLPQAPIFSNCPPDDLQPVYYANKGERNTVVTWSPPTANDNKGFVVEYESCTLSFL